MKTTKGMLVALLPVIPGAAAVATLVLYFADWPHALGHRGEQVAIGLGIGAVVWILAGVLGREFLEVEAASSRTYEELRGRVATLAARLGDLEHAAKAEMDPGKEAVEQAQGLALALKEDLHVGAPSSDVSVGAKRSDRSGYRWLRGHGYVNAWRELHQAEDLLLAVEPPEIVYATAITNLDRLAGTAASKETSIVTTELKSLVGGNEKADGGEKAKSTLKAVLALGDPPLVELAPQTANGKSSEEKAVARCDETWGRAIVRESAYRVHRKQNDAWDKIVNLRNRLLGLLAFAIALTYALLVLIVLQPGDMTKALTAATALFLVGAVVGVFNELYATSRLGKGTVFDYGLAYARLAATPVLSGIAALGGVLVTNFAGSFLINGDPSTSSVVVPKLTDVFSLSQYPMGLIVAAIFGLAPGLLLSRLRARSDEYEKQIADLSPSSQNGDASTGTSAAV